MYLKSSKSERVSLLEAYCPVRCNQSVICVLKQIKLKNELGTDIWSEGRRVEGGADKLTGLWGLALTGTSFGLYRR